MRRRVASSHITEIQRLLAERGETDALSHSADGYFLEIRFDHEGTKPSCGDHEFQDRVITVDSPFGTARVQFDHAGQLRSNDLS